MPLRLICITAHPDDECGAFGGALMQAHQRGVETSVICLTEGRAASYRGVALSDDELADLRREEFAAALRVLEVDHGEVLQYPDGRLAGQDFLSVTTVLVERIRRFRPQVVLTFGGDGNVNLHPDHTMVSFFSTAAFYWAGRQNFAPEQIAAGLLPYRPQKLFYGAAPFLVWADPEEARKIPLMPASLVLELGDLKGKKFEAFLQHKTQGELLAKVKAVFDETGAQEKYLLAGARGFRSSPMETDMFAGVEAD
ncbi:MAG: PIG-L family deacetylase [Acidobacteriaceae bacterium]